MLPGAAGSWAGPTLRGATCRCYRRRAPTRRQTYQRGSCLEATWTWTAPERPAHSVGPVCLHELHSGEQPCVHRIQSAPQRNLGARGPHTYWAFLESLMDMERPVWNAHCALEERKVCLGANETHRDHPASLLLSRLFLGAPSVLDLSSSCPPYFQFSHSRESE